MLGPGEYLTIFCDDNVEQGPLHAPFTIKQGGDTLLLTTSNPQSGAMQVVDLVATSRLANDQAQFRLSPGGPWSLGAATPGSQNVTMPIGLPAWRDGQFVMRYAFATEPGEMYNVECADELNAVNWVPMQAVPGTGFESFYEVVPADETETGFVRVRTDRP